MKKISLLFIGITLLATACATIYTASDFRSMSNDHKIMAILPFEVVIESKKLPKGMTVEMLKEAEQDEARAFQSVVHSVLLNNMSKGKYRIKFQDIGKTNSMLRKNDVTYDKLGDYDKGELAEMLDVDAISSGIIRRAQPMSAGTAIVLGVLTGIGGSTNKVSIDFTIHDGKTSELLWKYTHEASGGLLSNSESLAKNLMKQVAAKFPYEK